MNIPTHLTELPHPPHPLTPIDPHLVFAISAALAAGIARWLDSPTAAFHLCGNYVTGKAMLTAAANTWGDGPGGLQQPQMPNLFLYPAHNASFGGASPLPHSDGCVVFCSTPAHSLAEPLQQLYRAIPTEDWITIHLPGSNLLNLHTLPRSSMNTKTGEPSQTIGHRFLCSLTAHSIEQTRKRIGLAASDFLSKTDYHTADDNRKALISPFAMISAIGELAAHLQVTKWPAGMAQSAGLLLLKQSFS